jgi:hypothetical protein
MREKSAKPAAPAVAIARMQYPRPQELEERTAELPYMRGFSHKNWLYLGGGALRFPDRSSSSLGNNHLGPLRPLSAGSCGPSHHIARFAGHSQSPRGPAGSEVFCAAGDFPLSSYVLWRVSRAAHGEITGRDAPKPLSNRSRRLSRFCASYVRAGSPRRNRRPYFDRWAAG